MLKEKKEKAVCATFGLHGRDHHIVEGHGLTARRGQELGERRSMGVRGHLEEGLTTHQSISRLPTALRPELEVVTCSFGEPSLFDTNRAMERAFWTKDARRGTRGGRWTGGRSWCHGVQVR